MHLLWADDLILIADTCNGLQRQLDGLQEFCSKNLTAVNEIKTKCMAFGKIETVQVKFNSKPIEQVYQYKFLGNILKSVKRLNQSIFAENHLYLANQAKKAVGAMYSRIRDVGTLQPHIMLHMYDCLVKPITVYGSEVWGHHHPAQSEADKIFFRFARQVLRVKPTTSNIIVLGECGVLPPSVQCIISVLCYMNRLHNLPNDLLVKQAYCEMLRLENNGFCTWTSNVCELARSYGLDISLTTKDFKKNCKQVVRQSFISNWFNNVNNIVRNPLLRTYQKIKTKFQQEPYLYLIKEHKHRVALSRLRASSHTLEIERGRHDRPKKPIEARLCSQCTVIEDELHFVCQCMINNDARECMYDKINRVYGDFNNLSEEDKFLFLMSNDDVRILNWFGKFIYHSFQIRDRKNWLAAGTILRSTIGSLIRNNLLLLHLKSEYGSGRVTVAVLLPGFAINW